ncbi:hypothetical protein ANCDUO_05992 [Ancylostoma duodenale]|uniref:Uncharacterized protein n=1 Tax=Ancylostoma duodenale TaxID=51022 RepID=A0A0C2D2U5_9BILA|nr:hypothetical protein ANCDUO_05992 [Ancylostoma duodenale]
MLCAPCLQRKEDVEPASNDGPTMKQRIAATGSAMEDVVATRITSLTIVAAKGHAGKGICVAQLSLKPFTRQCHQKK